METEGYFQFKIIINVLVIDLSALNTDIMGLRQI